VRLNACGAEKRTTIHTDLGAIFVSLELSRSNLADNITVARSGREDVKHAVRGGNIAELLVRFAEIKEKARRRTGKDFRIMVIQEAGLDGFWIHRVWRKRALGAMWSIRPRS
jgi:transposase